MKDDHYWSAVEDHVQADLARDLHALVAQEILVKLAHGFRNFLSIRFQPRHLCVDFTHQADEVVQGVVRQSRSSRNPG